MRNKDLIVIARVFLAEILRGNMGEGTTIHISSERSDLLREMIAQYFPEVTDAVKKL